MKKINGDKKGMIIFNPKNDDQNEKMKNEKNMISSPWLAEMNIIHDNIDGKMIKDMKIK